jgi:hypothetical protein
VFTVHFDGGHGAVVFLSQFLASDVAEDDRAVLARYGDLELRSCQRNVFGSCLHRECGVRPFCFYYDVGKGLLGKCTGGRVLHANNRIRADLEPQGSFLQEKKSTIVLFLKIFDRIQRIPLRVRCGGQARETARKNTMAWALSGIDTQ